MPKDTRVKKIHDTIHPENYQRGQVINYIQRKWVVVYVKGTNEISEGKQVFEVYAKLRD